MALTGCLELWKKLKQKKIKHQVLNAKFHEKEAEIIAQAGRPGTVTIATNMAGRGTDIILGGNINFEIQKELYNILTLAKNYTISENNKMAVRP